MSSIIPISRDAIPDGTMGSDRPASFADRIKILIREQGSVTKIAKSCGFSEGVVRSWRDGRSDPSRERCLTLARALGVSLMWLVAGEGAMRETSRPERESKTPAMLLETTGREERRDMDPRRLTAAMRSLQSALSLAGAGDDTLTDHADLLAEYYALMGQHDPLIRAEKVTELHGRLAQRLRPPAKQA